jgi:hypothetical protein
MATASKIILWLTPAEAACTFFCDTIRRLALDHDAPLFEPHLTLGPGDPSQLRAISAAPITLPIIGLDYSDRFTKTLFVRFELTTPLVQLRRSLGMEAAGYDPHLSLLYQRLSDSTKRQLATTLTPPFSTVTFNAIAAIRCPAEVFSRADVEAWVTVSTKTLAS